MKRFAACILLSAACVLPQGAAAAVDIFGKFTGVEGESVSQDHPKWINVDAYSWGASNSGSIGPGTGQGSGKVDFADFSFTKLVDKSSPVLLLALAKGTHFDEALFDVVRTGGDPVNFLQYAFTDVLMTSYSIGSGGDIPTESWSFTFGKVQMTYRPQDAKGNLGSPVTFSWDVAKNAAAAVPEPSTWAMLVAGLLFVVFFGRNRVRARGLAT
jgi:type VI secretion system secreted protein Hcp